MPSSTSPLLPRGAHVEILAQPSSPANLKPADGRKIGLHSTWAGFLVQNPKLKGAVSFNSLKHL